jgi:molecular chaperone DnaJ
MAAQPACRVTAMPAHVSTEYRQGADKMAKRDFYEVLGVAKTHRKTRSRRPYRKLAMKYHPDRNPDSKDAEENSRKSKKPTRC